MCLCSDGLTRPQLLKGKDDLRQDAVMQQVLSIVNDLIAGEPEIFEQKFSIRTYKVVPLSMVNINFRFELLYKLIRGFYLQRTGILEWCENTIPIGLYLCGDNTVQGAHKKYRPKDYSVRKCRTLSMVCFLKF